MYETIKAEVIETVRVEIGRLGENGMQKRKRHLGEKLGTLKKCIESAGSWLPSGKGYKAEHSLCSKRSSLSINNRMLKEDKSIL